MRVFVTGASGFLGQRLVAELLNRGMNVRCLVRSKSGMATLARNAASPGRLEVVHGSLAKPASYSQALEGCQTAFHLAAAVRGSTSVFFLENVIGTRQFIREASRAGIGRLVLVSSLGVYGTSHLRAGDELNEDCPLDPNPHLRDGYSFSKIVQEKAAREAYQAGAMSLVVIRPGVIYGPGRNCLGNRIGLRLGPYLLKMGGGQRLPYTFVDNCANAIYLAGVTPAIDGEAFNIVDDSPPSARALLRQYRREVERVPVLSVPYPIVCRLSHFCEWYHRWSKGQLPDVLTRYKSAALWKPLHYSNEKAKSVLGWEPKVTFADGLRQTFDWLRAQKTVHQSAAA